MNDRVTKEEIEKWLSKIEAVELDVLDEKGEDLLTNMRAYISDSRHFLDKGDLVRSFEAVVWAWAILELCMHLGLFQKR